MSTKAINYLAAYWRTHQHFTPTVRLVGNTLARYADPDGSKAFPSIRTIAEETGLHEVTVKKSLRVLLDFEVIEQDGYATRRTKGGRQAVPVYNIIMDGSGGSRELPPEEAKGVAQDSRVQIEGVVLSSQGGSPGFEGGSPEFGKGVAVGSPHKVDPSVEPTRNPSVDPCPGFSRASPDLGEDDEGDDEGGAVSEPDDDAGAPAPSDGPAKVVAAPPAPPEPPAPLDADEAGRAVDALLGAYGKTGRNGVRPYHVRDWLSTDAGALAYRTLGLEVLCGVVTATGSALAGGWPVVARAIANRVAVEFRRAS